jgi:outer membrane protein TolC
LQLSGVAGGQLGGGTLQTVYDPAIQETQIASALSVFDAQFTTQLTWGKNTQPFNNAIQAGFFGGTAARYPIIFTQETAQFVTQIQKRTATGATLGVAHNIQYLFSNSPSNVYPSAYTSNVQLTFSQPLLGGNAQNGPSGLEANRAPIIIARLGADQAVWRFKAEVMAMVRSIEQQYWVLSHKYVALWSAQTAFDLSEDLLEDVKANQAVGSRRGSRRDLADAQWQVEQARLNLVTATSDLLYTERQLRNILGLPPADNRRIVPTSEPTDARLEPDWESSLAQMISFQPDIVIAQFLVRVAELQLLVARNQLLPSLNFDLLYQFNGLGNQLDDSLNAMTGGGILAFDPMVQLAQRQAGLNSVPSLYRNFQTWQMGFTLQMPVGFRGPLANVQASQYALLRQRAYLQQVVHQTTHSLARFFLEVDDNYKSYRAATRLREAAAMRLDYNKARYDAGDRDPSQSEEAVTIGVLIDSINQWTNAIATEAQFKSTYNTSIAVLEEAKGTLLGYDNVALAEGPWPRKAYIQAHDQQEAHRQHPTGADGPYHPEPVSGPAVPDPVPVVSPPDLGPPGPVPALPGPGGNLGPMPRSAPPQIPAGEPNTLSSLTPASPSADASVLPAAGLTEVKNPLPTLPERALPTAEPATLDLPILPPATNPPSPQPLPAEGLPPLPAG